jgi:transglutaminase-like putative cysteine protease
MVDMQHTREKVDYRQPLRASGVMLAQSIPLMAVMFLLFPRLDGPLWGMPADAYSGATGLSDSMRPGSMNRLVLSEEVAMRVTFHGPLPPNSQLYWRGPVLTDYDGRTWTPAPREPLDAISPRELEGVGDALRYEVTIEPHNRRFLLALDIPAALPPRTRIDADLQLRSSAPVRQRERYEMQSWTNYRFGVAENAVRRQRALALPPGLNPRTRELGQQLRVRYGDNAAIVRAALNMLRDQNFVYTLEPPLLGPHAADDFLFITRSGFCEHFASAFVLLMRAAGVPARVVTGYLGGEFNQLGRYLIVRQSDAHAWTEVWLDGRGWVRMDPTNLVSPARVESGLAAALPEASMLRHGIFSNALTRQLSLTFDSIANAWNQSVLGYNAEMQRALMFRAGFDDATWRTLAILLVISATAVTVLLVVFTLRQRGTKKDAALEAYQLFCRKAARAGLVRSQTEGPEDFQQRVARARPDLAASSRVITSLYVAVRYKNINKIIYLKDLRQRVAAFST